MIVDRYYYHQLNREEQAMSYLKNWQRYMLS